MRAFTALLLLSASLAACGNPSSTDSAGTTIQPAAAPTYKYTHTTNWTFNPKKSTADWTRILDQKATKRQVKLFGNMVDVEMGPVKLDMSGNVTLTEGQLSTQNDDFHAGQIVFDMATFHFAQEKGQGLFNIKEYPHSTLEFLSFSPKDSAGTNHTAQAKLTIQEHAQEYSIPLQMTRQDSLVQLKGSFKFNTLDYPLRDNITKKDINKDVITVKLALQFDRADTRKDSVRTN